MAFETGAGCRTVLRTLSSRLVSRHGSIVCRCAVIDTVKCKPGPSKTPGRPFVSLARRSADLEPQNKPTGYPQPEPPSAVSSASSISSPKIQQFAKSLRAAAPQVTETYVAYGTTKGLYEVCAKPGLYRVPQAGVKGEKIPKNDAGEDIGVGEGPWHTKLNLPATFSAWSQITMLHIYLLNARFRMFDAKMSSPWGQHLLDHFFFDAEEKMVTLHNMTARSMRQAYLKDMFVQYRGVVAAYDEGIAKGDAVLATAVWRNLYGAKPEANAEHLATIVSYMRHQLSILEQMSDEQVTSGDIRFGSFEAELPVVAKAALQTTEEPA